MGIRKAILFVSAVAVLFGAMSIASADAAKVERKPQLTSTAAARLIKSRPAYDRWGRRIGTAYLTVYRGPSRTKAVASSYSGFGVTGTSYVRSRTCTAEFYLKNLYGQKVISFRLIQSFSYNGSRITRLDQPIVSVSTKWGWQQSSLSKGKYWRAYPWSARSWASAKFDLKIAWYVVQTYRPTIYLNLYGSGGCYAGGYW